MADKCERCGRKIRNQYGVCSIGECRKYWSRAWHQAHPLTSEEIHQKNKTYYWKNKERITANNLEWRKNNVVKIALNGAKRNAKLKNVPFELTIDNVPPIPEICPVLGIKLERRQGEGRAKDNAPSLDRIIPSVGYVPNNVIWVSQRVNILKRDATISELKQIADYYQKLIDARVFAENACMPNWMSG